MSDQTKPIVLIAEPDEAQRREIAGMVADAGFEPVSAETGQAALDQFYADPPRCMLLRHGLTLRDGSPLLPEIKSDNVYGHLPVILLLSPGGLEAGIDWNTVEADDYLVPPVAPQDLLNRMEICWARSRRDVNANPLTGLPGNLNITREAERRLASRLPFAFAYLDLDAFKAFNDKYGFARGDEVLRMTARLLVSTIRSFRTDDGYVGHVGGDDFVFMTPPELMERACGEIQSSFDHIVKSFYDDEDRTNGYITTVDRQGNAKKFPFVSCSIGVVDCQRSKITHIAELFSRVTEMKSLAKQSPESRCLFDQRK